MLEYKNLLIKYKYLIIAIVTLVILVSYIIVYASSNDAAIIKPVSVPLTEKEITDITIHVDIKGEVKNPGVYEINQGSMIIDMINISGGLTDKADTSITNLAYKLSDATSIRIYSKQDVLDTKKIELPCICPTTEDVSCIISDIDNTTIDKTMVSINDATLQELDTLDGIGPSIAQKIIDYRTQNGTFDKIEDIKNVSGIGESLFAKIKDYITL